MGVPFKVWEERIMTKIAEAYRLPYPLDPQVKQADNVLLATEKRDLMSESPDEWIDLPEPLDDIILRPLAETEEQFMQHFAAAMCDRVTQ